MLERIFIIRVPCARPNAAGLGCIVGGRTAYPPAAGRSPTLNYHRIVVIPAKAGIHLSTHT